MFSFHHWFLLSLSGVFIVDCISSLHHCFFRCFYFTTVLTIVFPVFSFHQLLLPCLFFVMYFVFVLLYCECYGFGRAFFYSQAIFTLHSFLTFGSTCFYQGFLGAGSSTLKIAGPPTEVRNTDPAHLFIWITQCSAKGISGLVLFMY